MARVAERREVRANMGIYYSTRHPGDETEEEEDEGEPRSQPLSASELARLALSSSPPCLCPPRPCPAPFQVTSPFECPTQHVPQASAPPPRRLGPRASPSHCLSLPPLSPCSSSSLLLTACTLTDTHTRPPRSSSHSLHAHPTPPALHPLPLALTLPAGRPGAHRDHARRQHLQAHPGRPHKGARPRLRLSAVAHPLGVPPLTSLLALSLALSLSTVRRRLLGAPPLSPCLALSAEHKLTRMGGHAGHPHPR